MKRFVVGGLALGFTAVGTLALGGPAGAQEEEPQPEFVELAGQLSAESVAPGEEITATPVEPCSIGGDGELYWLVWSPDSDEPIAEDVAPLEADGTWSVTFEAPADAGEYEFDAYCVPTDLPGDEEAELEARTAEELATFGGEGEEPTPEEPPGEEPFTIEYYALLFAVDGGDGPPVTEPPADTPAPPVAAPAQPVVGEPTFTG